MALGIRTEDEIYTVFSIPLEWEENTILANHFRMLADSIEKEGVKILTARMEAPLGQPYSKPRFEIVAFTRGSE